MDVESEFLLAIFGLNVGMFGSIPVDTIATLATTKQKPKKIDIVKKSQDVWSMKMPWVEIVFDVGGNMIIIQYKVYTKIKRKEKLLIPKWDSLEYHARKMENG
jgi:hypothetical protein